ncbi:tRNA(Ser) Um(44) 2'-O-methyltransferase [Dispira simplex]|nr:tRNA(Ser) Um(44) 2'-O-methyltransferase [Dispira simplex]
MEYSWGWDEKAKRDELFDGGSRFLLVESVALDHVSPSFCVPTRVLVAFVMFRFCFEETMGDVDEPVLYCKLLQYMEAIGLRWYMRKSMLTCFKANSPAILFYYRHGYAPDEISPSQVLGNEDTDTYDYEILSKHL